MALHQLRFTESELLYYIKNSVDKYMRLLNLDNITEKTLDQTMYSLEHFCALYKYHYNNIPVIYLDKNNITNCKDFNLLESKLVKIVKMEVEQNG